MKLITRARAKETRQKYYFTGKMCKNGHIALRSTGGGKCTGCVKMAREPQSKGKASTSSLVFEFIATLEKGTRFTSDQFFTMMGVNFSKRVATSQALLKAKNVGVLRAVGRVKGVKPTAYFVLYETTGFNPQEGARSLEEEAADEANPSSNAFFNKLCYNLRG